MKKVKVLFMAVVEDDAEDVSKLYGAKEQVNILEKLLRNNLVGSKNLKARIRYASREVSDENGVVESVDTLIEDEPCGAFECFHCGERSVIWQSDFMFEDYGYEGEGIVQNLTCMNCGAEIEYMVPFGPREE